MIILSLLELENSIYVEKSKMLLLVSEQFCREQDVFQHLSDWFSSEQFFFLRIISLLREQSARGGPRANQ